ncbi:MAG: deoxyguanosinetriphosphate triphosphohydrolase [Alteromonadaceae bacterium]|nr:deoxyguanosinetriphosphate triphosphohydrolase [Alteromonadaceae bacterium]
MTLLTSTPTNNENNIIQFPYRVAQHSGVNKGWSYLLSDSVAFQKNVEHAIRIQKPDQEKIPTWIKRLITSGQCRSIYVEDLSLTSEERISIHRLCEQYSVSLVAVSVNDKAAGNIVQGPW